MVDFIEVHRDAHGVEPICGRHGHSDQWRSHGSMPSIGPSTYYDHLAKRADPARLSDRAGRDGALRPEIRRVFEENWQVYGIRKVWRQLAQEGFDVARCLVARLMKDMGIHGIIRGRPHRTTIPDRSAPCPLDKVNRAFQVPAPNMLWGCPLRRHWFKPNGRRFHIRRDLEGVRLCRPRHSYPDHWRSRGSIIDAYARKIVGWRASTLAQTGFVLIALEQAVHDRRPTKA